MLSRNTVVLTAQPIHVKCSSGLRSLLTQHHQGCLNVQDAASGAKKISYLSFAYVCLGKTSTLFLSKSLLSNTIPTF